MSSRLRLFRRLVAATAALTVVGAGIQLAAHAETGGAPSVGSQIVRFAAGTSADERATILADAGAVEVSSVPQLRLYAVEVSDAGAAALRSDARVQGVEADQVRAAEATPSDPGYADQWALPKIGWDEAYGTVDPDGSATVAVLDTGVNPGGDLAGKLVDGASVLEGDDTTTDPNGHGTAMANIVAAGAGNDEGIAGVGYAGVSVMPVKVLGADGTGQDSDIVAGVVYAADHGADVILMSFSNPGRSEALQAAVDYAWSKGAVLVAATGNDGSTAATYPAGTAKVVGVSATTRDDTLWSGSNSGADTFLGAPGVDIATGEGALTGTSTSAAIVAGAAALLKAAHPSASNGVVVGRLARNADAAGSTGDTGNGRVNLARALADDSTDAVVPQGVAGDGGPFVGPYVAAANVSGVLQGQANPACSSGGTCPWQSTSLTGWSEGQTIPMRLAFDNGQSAANPSQFQIQVDHSQSNGAVPGLEGLTNFTKSSNVTITGGFPAGIVLTGITGDIWTYTFTADLTDNNAGFVAFDSGLRAGAHNFTGNSLQVKGGGTLGVFKPAAAPGTPNLSLTKTAPASVVAGQTMTYSLNYRNLASGSGTTNRATSTQLSDTLPAGVTYVAGSCSGCTYDSLSRTLTWNLGTINAGSALASRSFQVVVDGSLSNGSTVTNTARILSAENDADLANNTATATTTVVAAVISGRVIFDANGDGAFDSGEVGLAGATVSLYKDSNNNTTFEPATDLQVGSSVTTPASGEWAFTSGIAASTRYFVVRGNPTGYTSTNAIAETVASSTDHSTATKGSNDRINVLFDSSVTAQYSAGNVFLARVTQQDQTIDFAQPTTPRAYGSTFTVNPTASSGLPVSLVATGSCSITPSSPGWTVTMTSGTGSCVLTASQAGDSSWSAAPEVQRTVDATKAVLSINAENHSKAYGELDPAATYTLSGFVGTDNTGNATTGTASCSIGAHSENVGTHTGVYTCAVGGLTAANYSFTAGTAGNLTISKKQLLVNADDKTKVYGENDPAATGTLTGFIDGDNAGNATTGTPSCSIGAHSENAATYTGVITCTTAGLTSTNYSFAVGSAGNLTISKKRLLVNADDKAKVYGENDPAATGTLTGFIDGDNAGNATTGTPSCSIGAHSENAATYTGVITCTTAGLTSTNYSFAVGSAGNLTISKKQLLVNADDKTKVYGENDPAATGTLTGFIDGEDASAVSGTPACTGPTAHSEGVGTYPNRYSCTTAGLTASNYSFAVGSSGSLTITAKQLVVNANDRTKTYGADDPGATFTITGYAGTEDATSAGVTGAPTCTGPTSHSEDVGTYPDVYSCTLGNLAAPNYTFAVGAQGDLTITKKELLVNAKSQTKVYGSDDPGADYTITGFVGSDTAANATSGAPVCTGPSTHDEDADTYPGVYTCTLGDLAADNYSFAVGSAGDLTITKKQLLVNADGKSKVYGEDDPTATYSLTGFEYSDDESDIDGSASCSIGSHSQDVDTYTDIITCTLGDLAADNYSFAVGSAGDLTITKKQLLVNADGKTKVYGEDDPTATYSLTGFEYSDDESDIDGSASCSIGSHAQDVDTYTGIITCTLGDLAADNYSFAVGSAGDLTITKKQLLVNADGKTKVYGSSDPSATYTLTGFAFGQDASTGGVSGLPSCSGPSAHSEAVGVYANRYTCTVGGLTASNYSFAVGSNGSLTITPKQLLVNANDRTKVYGAVDPGATYTIAGFEFSDTQASATSGAPTCSGPTAHPEDVGTYANRYSCTVGNLSADNYTFAVGTSGSLGITKKELLFNAGSKTKVYGAADPAASYTLTGFEFSDTQASATSGAASCTIGSHAQDVGTYTGIYTCGVGSLTATNYTFAPGTAGDLTITPKELTVNADNKTKPFGSADPAATYTITGFAYTDTQASATTGSASCSGSSSHSQNVGVYPGIYTCTLGSLSASNYTFALGTSGSLTITAADTSTSVTATPGSAQYSDQVTLTATVTSAAVGTTPSGKVVFTVAGEGAGVEGTVNASGQASVTIKLAGQVTPAGATSLAKNVTAAYASNTANFSDSSGTTSLTETLEDAKIDYTGDGLKLTANANTNSATVNLAGVVKEAADGSIGDKLNTAKLKFTVYRFTDNTFSSPVGTCTTLTLTITSAGVANGACSLSLSVDNYVVKIELLGNGYYTAPVETVAVTVAVPGTGFVTGGGWIQEPNLGTKSNFGFTVKYLKKGIQGNSLYIYRKTVAANSIANPSGGYLPAGEYNWIIKSNAMEQMASGCTTSTPIVCTASFTGKSNVTAVNRTTGAPYGLGGNRQFQVDVTDKGEPGSSSAPVPDTYAIRVTDTNGTYYQLGSSNAQLALNGGNIQVRP